eukprot:GFUD01045249.1.p1 GENE.GFUD01045249.1~~GFUD01045249.1.p1  ORF type:complete len:247 (+),score=49.76 GFUD01045249.1:61-801(+)
MAYSGELAEGYNDTISSIEGNTNFDYVEAPNASRMLGDIAGLRVLDLACGTGRYTRWLKTSKQAAEVVGVDMSQDMIEKALEAEKRKPLNIQYQVADASKLLEEDLGTFDVCFAGYLLHYARDREMLSGFLESIYNLLRDGGSFVTLNQNPDDDQSHPEMIQYGFTTRLERFPPHEGDAVHIKMYTEGKFLCEFDNYYFTRGTYSECFHDSGFKNFLCEPLTTVDEDAKWNRWKQAGCLSVMKAHK